MYSCELYPTILTPFDSDLSIDYKSLERLICVFAQNGCDGIFAVCQSSEMFFLSDDEKLELAEFSINTAHEAGLKCVVSGHTQDGTDEQISYLTRLEKLKPDAIILVSNRFAAKDEGEDVCLENFKKVTSALDKDTRLGIYECPYPYKRLLTDELISAMKADGRFDFIKDTCCEIGEIKRRLSLLSGSGIKLFNANGATLCESIEAGAAGYSGVMLNMVPDLFDIIKRAFTGGYIARARHAARIMSLLSTIECQNYPANAKYLLKKRGVFATDFTRNGKPALTSSQMMEMDAFSAVSTQLISSAIPHALASDIFESQRFFPACHASSHTVLENGDVCAVYFAGSYEKCPDVGIWLSRRVGGEWKNPVRIAKVNGTAHWNPVIYPIKGGLRVTFRQGAEIPDWVSWHTESYDGGETWTRPVFYGKAVGPVRSKPIVLSDGRMLAPDSDETRESWLPRVDVSYDEGATFEKLADIPVNITDPSAPDYISGLGAIQPTLWESTPGRVHALLRTTCGFIFRSDSEDGGKTWCRAYSTGLPNNNSGIDVTLYNGVLYLIMNPVSGNWASRTPLTVYESRDNGVTFRPIWVCADAVIDEREDAESIAPEQMRTCEFSYPAITAGSGKLYITFTDRRRSIMFTSINIG